MSPAGLELLGDVLTAGVLLFAPGALMLLLLELWVPHSALFKHHLAGSVVWAATALALTLSLLPLLWIGATLCGLAWSPTSMSIALLAITVAGLALAGRRNLRGRVWPRPSLAGLGRRLPGLTLVAILLASCALRFVAVRDLAYPAWVDSPHHDLIVRLLTYSGQVPDRYDPFLPVTPFTYHFGFHAVAAVFVWLTGLPSSDAILVLGQVLNGLTPLAAYALARLTTRRVWVAVAAAAIVGLVSMFPGYYVSWGRYTQLTGLIILGPLLGVLAATAAPEHAGEGHERRADVGALIVIGVLSAGLVYAHYRVMAFAVTFALAALIVYRRLAWRTWAPAALLGIVLAGPWLWRLALVWVAPRVANPAEYLAPAGYNDFPWQYFSSWLERGWWALAAVGALTGLIRRDRALWLMALWTALTVGVLNIPGAGSWVVNNNSWAISAFLPGSIAAGYALVQGAGLGVWLWRRPANTPAWRRPIGVIWGATLASLIAIGIGLGVAAQARILNPRTVLALPADRQALAWMRENLPRDAVVVVNSWYWQSEIWSASDGGIWIWPETGLRTTTPPADYAFDPVWAQQINDWNARWAALTDLGSAEARAMLSEAGATHLYLGAVTGRMTPEMLDIAPDLYQLQYERDGVRVYLVTAP